MVEQNMFVSSANNSNLSRFDIDIAYLRTLLRVQHATMQSVPQQYAANVCE